MDEEANEVEWLEENGEELLETSVDKFNYIFSLSKWIIISTLITRDHTIWLLIAKSRLIEHPLFDCGGSLLADHYVREVLAVTIWVSI